MPTLKTVFPLTVFVFALATSSAAKMCYLSYDVKFDVKCA